MQNTVHRVIHFFNVSIFDYFCVDKGKNMEEHAWFFCSLLGRGKETTLDNFILFYPVNKIHLYNSHD